MCVCLTFTPLTAGSSLFDHQSAVLRDQRTFLLLTVGLPLLQHTEETGENGGDESYS